MAKIKGNIERMIIDSERIDDMQTIKITHEQARAYFDDQKLPSSFDDALDLAQGSIGEDGETAVLVLIIKD